MEPFLGSLSLALVWAAVLGIKKHDIPGALLVFYSGLVRDVLLVNRLGQSSIIFLIIWAAAVVIGSKLSKNLFSAAVPALAGYSVLSFLEVGEIDIWGSIAVVIMSVIIIGVWTWKDSREPGIKVRLSS